MKLSDDELIAELAIFGEFYVHEECTREEMCEYIVKLSFPMNKYYKTL